MSTSSRVDPDKLKAIDEAVLTIIRKHKQGLADDVLAKELNNLSAKDRADAINRLITAKRIQLFTSGPNKSVLYKEITAEEAAKVKGLGPEEIMVYQTIKAAGNAGLWTKDMRVRTNLAQPHIAKILRTLEARGMVKSVKNVNNPNRKVYMLSELEPSRDLTGGAWYTEQQFDSEFIKILREACLAFIKRKGDTTLRELAAFITAKKFSKVDLRDEDINAIVATLSYDNLVDTVESDDPNDDQEHFRPMPEDSAESTAFTSTPCGVCPVMDQCRDDGIISPATCEYYNKWLAMDF